MIEKIIKMVSLKSLKRLDENPGDVMKKIIIGILAMASFSVMASEIGNVCVAVCKYSSNKTIFVSGTGNRVSLSGPLAKIRKDEVVSYDLESKRTAFKNLKEKCSKVSGELLETELDYAGNIVKITKNKASRNSSCLEAEISDRIKDESKEDL